jgi:hypothetical protein
MMQIMGRKRKSIHEINIMAKDRDRLRR